MPISTDGVQEQDDDPTSLRDDQCPYGHVAVMTLRTPTCVRPLAPGGHAPQHTCTRPCPRCQV